jgi:hypothetical protein
MANDMSEYITDRCRLLASLQVGISGRRGRIKKEIYRSVSIETRVIGIPSGLLSASS